MNQSFDLNLTHSEFGRDSRRCHLLAWLAWVGLSIRILVPPEARAQPIDHQWADWTPAAGVALHGEHININRFTAPNDIYIHAPVGGDPANGGWLIIRANFIEITGNIHGEGRG